MHKVKFGISVLTIRFIVIRLLLSNTVVLHKNSLFLKRLEAITGPHSTCYSISSQTETLFTKKLIDNDFTNRVGCRS